MQLREGETIVRVFHHHPTPFVFHVIKAIGTSFPFFLLLFLFQGAVSSRIYLIMNLVVLFMFSMVIVYLALIYWLDRLIITNQRIIHVDWKYLTVRDESEARLDDIQDIQTAEKGVLSYFKIFDYGTFRLDTASSKVTIIFLDAPNPEEIRRFVYHIRHQ